MSTSSSRPSSGPLSASQQPAAPIPAPIASTSAAANETSASSAPLPDRIVPTKVLDGGIRAVPKRFEQCEIEDLIALIASMLTQLIEHNDQIPLTPQMLTRFHSRAPPAISVRDYLDRIARYTNVESCCLLILLHYVDRVCEARTDFTISSLTVHRFVIAAVSVGTKALSDSFCTNSRYAKVGGVSLVEMNLLERELLAVLDWRLVTTGALLDQYYLSLIRSNDRYEVASSEAGPMPAHTKPDAVGRVPSTRSSAQVSPHDVPMDVDGSPVSSSGLSSSSGQGSRPLSLQMSPRTEATNATSASGRSTLARALGRIVKVNTTMDASSKSSGRSSGTSSMAASPRPPAS